MQNSCPSIMIICIQRQTWGVSAGRGNGAARLLFIFLSNWGGARLGLGALCKLHTLKIVLFISHRPDHKGTLASDLKGVGARAFLWFRPIFWQEVKNVLMVDLLCGLLWCFYQLFGFTIWWHPFTAEDSDGMLHFSKSVSMKKHIFSKLYFKWCIYNHITYT